MVVSLTTVNAVSSVDRHEEIAGELAAARAAAEDGNLDAAFKHLMVVIEQVPDSVGALRSAVCIAPAVGEGELVPRLLADLLLADWDWRKVPIGCEIEQFYRSLFRVFDLGPVAIVYGLPDAEDTYSTRLAELGHQITADEADDIGPDDIAALSFRARRSHAGRVRLGRSRLDRAAQRSKGGPVRSAEMCS